MKSRLLELLTKYAYSKREVTLASGQKSDFYIDCKQVMFRGEAQVLVGELFYEQMIATEGPNQFSAVGGMELGAVPLATALSMTAARKGRELPAIVVRKEPKGHGTGAYLEGAAHIKPSRVLLVEDVVTTGGSTIKAAERLRAAGFAVDTVFSLVDREAGGKENLGNAGLRHHSLFTRRDFLSN